MRMYRNGRVLRIGLSFILKNQVSYLFFLFRFWNSHHSTDYCVVVGSRQHGYLVCFYNIKPSLVVTQRRVCINKMTHIVVSQNFLVPYLYQQDFCRSCYYGNLITNLEFLDLILLRSLREGIESYRRESIST